MLKILYLGVGDTCHSACREQRAASETQFSPSPCGSNSGCQHGQKDLYLLKHLTCPFALNPGSHVAHAGLSLLCTWGWP